jgi:NitT/TauT family transport system substrate-binding protein
MSDRVNRLSRRRLLQGAGGIALGVLGGAPARADETITYLFPAPPLLPAFGPIRLAQGKGYFQQAGLTVNFATGRGGVDVAKQVGAGNVRSRTPRSMRCSVCWRAPA